MRSKNHLRKRLKRKCLLSVENRLLVARCPETGEVVAQRRFEFLDSTAELLKNVPLLPVFDIRKRRFYATEVVQFIFQASKVVTFRQWGEKQLKMLLAEHFIKTAKYAVLDYEMTNNDPDTLQPVWKVQDKVISGKYMFR